MEIRPVWWNKIQFFPSSGCVRNAIWMHNEDAEKAYGEKAWQQLLKNATSYNEHALEATSYKIAAVRPPTTNHENHPN